MLGLSAAGSGNFILPQTAQQQKVGLQRRHDERFRECSKLPAFDAECLGLPGVPAASGRSGRFCCLLCPAKS